MKRISVLVVTLLAFTCVWGQGKVSPFTAHYLRGNQAVTRSLPASTELVGAYLHTVGTPDVATLEALGVKVNLQLDGVMTVRLPLSAIPALERLDFIKYIQMGTPVNLMLDKARSSAGVDRVHAAEGLDMAYTGKGVVVGIIDGGFDYTHPAFYDDGGAAGANLRIKRVWEQGDTTGPAPSGFGYGIELATPESIIAAGGDFKTQSHGSHVAAIAAGAYRVDGNPYYGVAPDADIVLVSKGKITTNSANISDAIAYIYNYADSVGKPCVVNMSLGWHLGPHDGSSAFDLVADKLQGPGRLLVGSMGNYGNDAVHVSKTFTAADDAPLSALVSYKITPSKSQIGGEIDIWGDEGMDFDLKVGIVKKSDGSEIDVMGPVNVASSGGATLEHTFSQRAVGTAMVTTEVNPINGKPHAYVSLNLESLNEKSYTVALIVTPRSAGTVHAWTDATYTTFSENVPEGWTVGDKHYTLCEIGGTGKKIISVGAYVSSNTYIEAGNSQVKMTDEELGALATFSSVGPTLDGRMKPDVVAPGTFIASAVNSHDSYKTSYPTASSVVWNDNIYDYSYMQGTSMAAPFVAGVIATWLQAHPTLDSDAIRQVLQKTAINDKYTTPATCGYGKIDAYAGLKEVLALAAGIEGTEADATAASFVVRHVGNALLLSFARPLGQTEVRLYDASGIRLQSHTLDVSEAGHTFTLPMQDLPHGLYLLRVGHETVKVVR